LKSGVCEPQILLVKGDFLMKRFFAILLIFLFASIATAETMKITILTPSYHEWTDNIGIYPSANGSSHTCTLHVYSYSIPSGQYYHQTSQFDADNPNGPGTSIDLPDTHPGPWQLHVCVGSDLWVGGFPGTRTVSNLGYVGVYSDDRTFDFSKASSGDYGGWNVSQ
jgi:hypothetical protein